MKEIERQFLCRRVDPGVLERADRQMDFVQGYLTRGDPAVRVRRIRQGDVERWVLTVKGGSGLVREEAEFELDPADGERLLDAAGGRRVEKTRYVVGRWEIDVYSGRYQGLLVAEVELEREGEPTPPAPEGVHADVEVTGKGRYTNQALAWRDREAAEALLEEVRWMLDEGDPG